MSPLAAILQTVFPAHCACCGDVLVHGERQICTRCLASLHASHFSTMPDNPTERLLMGRIHIEAATSLYHFAAPNEVRRVVHAMKFHSNPELCLLMGRLMGQDLLASSRFDGVDLLIPVPLHWLRQLRRGYNQSELLCRGIAEVMRRPLCTDAVVRHRYTHQQSLKPGHERRQNVDGAFRPRHTAQLAGKHILLVDDVLTTGATLTACADAIAPFAAKVSVATFAKA